MRTSRIIAFSGGLVLTAGLLTGCGSDEKKAATVGRTVTVTATTTVTATSTATPTVVPQPPVPQPSPIPGGTERGFYTIRSIAVRSAPSSSADVVGTFPNGTKVTGYVQGDWLQLTGGDPGYLPMSALEDPTPR